MDARSSDVDKDKDKDKVCGSSKNPPKDVDKNVLGTSDLVDHVTRRASEIEGSHWRGMADSQWDLPSSSWNDSLAREDISCRGQMQFGTMDEYLCSGGSLGAIESSAVQAAFDSQTQAVLLGGDFYREDQGIVRGMSAGIGTAVSSAYDASHWPGPDLPDFTSMDSIKRSADVLPPLGEAVLPRSDFMAFGDDLCPRQDMGALSNAQFFEDFWGELPSKENFVSPPLVAPLAEQPTDACNGRFVSINAPIEEPEDGLEANTIFARDCSPAEAGNRLLDFFDEHVESRITKVTPKKYCFKAEAFLGCSCEVKVRIYLQESGTVALEFEKRSGDSIAFNSLFRRARQHLCKKDASIAGSSGPAVASSQLPAGLAPPSPFCSTDLDFAGRCALPEERDAENAREIDGLTEEPLLNIVNNTEDPVLLAEAASGLARMAQDSKMARSICKPEAIADLKKLFQSNDFRITCSMAKLQATVAEHAQVDCCADKLLEKAAQELAVALAEALKGRKPQDRSSNSVSDHFWAPHQKVLSIA